MTPDTLGLSYEQLRTVVVESLRTNGISQFANLRRQVAATAVKLGFGKTAETDPNGGYGRHLLGNGRREDYLPDRDYAAVQSIIWDLIIEGVVRPRLNDGNNNDFPFLHITEWGRVALEHGPTTPYDPDGYLTRLKADVPNLDPVILTYLDESLHTFRINCLLSSTISLGCASEKALLLLIGAYGDSLPGSARQKFKEKTDGRMIKRQFEDFRKAVDGELRARLPHDLEDGLDVELNAIFDFIRNQRNDAGHPTGKTVERERAYANLVVLPVYLRKVYAMIGWLQANPKP